MAPIRKVTVIWKCPHCGTEYPKRRKARECEERTTLSFAFAIGTKLVLYGRPIEAPYVFNVKGITNIEILEQLRSPSGNEHTNMYVILIEGNYHYKVSEYFIKMHMENGK